jgi:hypothetical protein
VSPRFAWDQYRRPWDLEVHLDDVSGDGNVAAPVTDADHRRLRLDAVGEWETVRVSFQLSTTEQRPQGIDHVNGYVLVSSPRTHTRFPIPLEAMEDGVFAGSADLSRALLAGPVELAGQVVTGDSPVQLVGLADPWNLVVDASDAPPLPGAPPFDMAWVDFSADDAPPVARSAQDSYAVMDLTGSKPALLLNSEIQGFQALLNSDKARLERRRLRDTLATGIARYALSSLFREARAQITMDGEDDVAPPEDSLLRQVCESVAAELKAVSSVDELYVRLANETALTRLERARLWVEIDNAIDRLTNHSEMVASIVEEVRHA